MSAEELAAVPCSRPRPGALRRGTVLRPLATTLGPILAALVIAGLVLLAVGVDPLRYYGYVIERGLLSPSGLEQTLTRAAPLLMLAAGLIIAFRAGIWNLGVDGQFLLGALSAAVSAPWLNAFLPSAVALGAAIAIAATVGALWSLVPALLRAYYQVNEIVTTLMMTFLGLSLANALVKLVFLDPTTTVPQTVTLAVDDRLPRLFGTTVTSALPIALAVIVVVHVVMERTAFGLRLRVVGANAAAARHVGLDTPRLTIAVFALSAAMAGAAGALDIVGVYGNVRADWNPGYGLLVIPMVFLARLNGFASIAFVLLLAVLLIGGESAARRLGVPSDFTLVLVATVLIVLAAAEHLTRHLAAAPRD